MIAPYGTVINSHLNQIKNLGLDVFRNTDYVMSFRSGKRMLTFSAEPAYHPSLSSNLVDDFGVEREMGLLMSVVDPELYAQMMETLKSQRAANDFEHRTFLEIVKDGSLAKYVDSELGFFLEFLQKDGKSAFAMPVEQQQEYARKENALLARFGVRQ